MKRAQSFTLPPTWQILLADMGLQPEDVLTCAGLPHDLFKQESVQLTAAEYFRFWHGMDQLCTDTPLPLLLAEHLSTESFDTALFACICSANLNQALQRISQFKPLIGPMIIEVDQQADLTRLEISCYGYTEPLPKSLGLTELTFFTQLSRLATRAHIRPIHLGLTQMPNDPRPYIKYFDCELSPAEVVTLSFAADDAHRPFLTANARMWDFFEDHLNQRLKDLDHNTSTTERVRAVLLESLPGGASSIEHTAARLAVSKRTLQRKLHQESASFQSVLKRVRGELADHYLSQSQIPLAEIAFLLGFQETNSFFRAYQNWRSMTPNEFRMLNQKPGSTCTQLHLQHP